MNKLNIAVIGSGVAGLSAAWLLSANHRVTLYERETRPGGHAHTLDVDTPDGPIPVDTGFMVFNETTYPDLTALFATLGVDTESTEMSFSLSMDAGTYEYAGSGFSGFFGQRANIVRPGHWRLLADIARFFRTAPSRIDRYAEGMSLGHFLHVERYSTTFVDRHIVPMGAAIWSTPAGDMLDFPARTFIDFYGNHGMLQFRGRPQWRTVSGGSRTYVDRLLADRPIERRLSNSVKRIARHSGYAYIEEANGTVRPFDHVVVATHADEALALLDDPDPLETKLLGCFSYQRNRACLHSDRRWMPRRKRLWSSWNYLSEPASGGGLCVTYWMNRLQHLKTGTNLFVTLNPTSPIHPKAVVAELDYTHPVFDNAAIEAQKALWALQGGRRTWFCGSYFGYGFHEDGIQSGLAVAEQLGGAARPWTVDRTKARIATASVAHSEAAE